MEESKLRLPPRYSAISDEKLKQQFVNWNRADFTVEKYGDFLDSRASRLADEANKFLLALSGGLPEPCRPNLKLASKASW